MIIMKSLAPRYEIHQNSGPKFIQIGPKNDPEEVLKATSAMQANLGEFGIPNLQKMHQNWDPNSTQNAPRIHP